MPWRDLLCGPGRELACPYAGMRVPVRCQPLPTLLFQVLKRNGGLHTSFQARLNGLEGRLQMSGIALDSGCERVQRLVSSEEPACHIAAKQIRSLAPPEMTIAGRAGVDHLDSRVERLPGIIVAAV